MNFCLNTHSLSHTYVKLDAQLPVVEQSIIDKLSVRYENPLDTPKLSLIVASGCNVECKYCYNYTQKHIKMSPEMAVGFLRAYFNYQKINGINHTLRQITFAGGEPTLNPEAIIKAMEYINKADILCLPMILTNGIMSSSLLDRLIDMRFSFQISYDGFNNPLRQTLSGKAQLTDKIIKTIDRVAQANLPIVLRATISAETVSGMTDVVKFAAAHKIDSLICAPMCLMGNALNYSLQQPDISEYIDNLFKAKELADTLGIKFTPCEITRFHNKGEFREFPKLVLLPDGSVSVTTRFLTAQEPHAKQVIFGKYSVSEGLSIDTDSVTRIINNFIRNTKPCVKCDAYQYCRGRNMNISSFTSNIPKDNYPCAVTVKLFQELTQRSSMVTN